MKISKAEQEAIQQVVRAGRVHGFGNMIAHLKSAWAMHLVSYGLDAEAEASRTGGYPPQMHVDLMERGEWDETGRRYTGDAGGRDEGCRCRS